MTGCAGWQAVQVSPTAFNPPPPELRLTRQDGWETVLARPRLDRDTIRGVRAEEPHDSIVMPVSQVRTVALPTRHDLDALTRVGVLAGFLAVFTGILYFGARGTSS